MYQQKIQTKKFTTTDIILNCVFFTLVLTGVFFLFRALTFSCGYLGAAIIGALTVIPLAVFSFLPKPDEYVYTIENDTLTLEKFSEDKLLKSASIDLKYATIFEGIRGFYLYCPILKKAYTIAYEGKAYVIAPDRTLGKLLNLPSETDNFIDAHKKEMLNDIATIVSYPSTKQDPLPDMPFGEPCALVLQKTLELCENMGMRTKNVDNYCGWAEIGEGTHLIGVLCHLDVVPEGEGWDTDPYKMEIKDGFIFGRGVSDDKGPAVAAIYAVKALLDTNKTLNSRIRLIFGCNEESGWACMDRYKRSEELPDLAFSPDASYPVINTERGIAHIQISTGFSSDYYKVNLSGGLCANMVPANAQATISGNIDALKEKLTDLDESISISFDQDIITLNSVGKSAHGSSPREGKNAYFPLFKLLASLDLGGDTGDFLNYASSLFADDIWGKSFGLDITDASGTLSLNLGMAYIGKNNVFPEMTEQDCKLVLDIRYPLSLTLDELLSKIKDKIPALWSVEVVHSQPHHHVDENSKLVTTLMKVYKDYTKRVDKLLSIGGGTYARAFPGKAVAFGTHFIGETENIHAPNEKKEIANLVLSAKMFATALEKLANNE